MTAKPRVDPVRRERALRAVEPYTKVRRGRVPIEVIVDASLNAYAHPSDGPSGLQTMCTMLLMLAGFVLFTTVLAVLFVYTFRYLVALWSPQ